MARDPLDESTELLWVDEWLGNPPTNQLGYLVVGGFQLPHIRLIKSADPANDGLARLSIDNRYGSEYMPEDEIKRWAWLMANAMAVSAGFTSFNGNGRRYDSFFATRVGMIGSDLLGQPEKSNG